LTQAIASILESHDE
jgi:hypothetical protein